MLTSGSPVALTDTATPARMADPGGTGVSGNWSRAATPHAATATTMAASTPRPRPGPRPRHREPEASGNGQSPGGASSRTRTHRPHPPCASPICQTGLSSRTRSWRRAGGDPSVRSPDRRPSDTTRLSSGGLSVPMANRARPSASTTRSSSSGNGPPCAAAPRRNGTRAVGAATSARGQPPDVADRPPRIAAPTLSTVAASMLSARAPDPAPRGVAVALPAI